MEEDIKIENLNDFSSIRLFFINIPPNILIGIIDKNIIFNS